MLIRLRSGEVSFPPLSFQWKEPKRPQGPDATVRAKWAGKSYRFVAEFKGRSTPQVFAQALIQAKRFADQFGDNPLIVVPFLSRERLDDLQRENVSGLDLCGNGLIIVPGQLFILRSGAPNRFRESFPIRDVYRGNTSLVARSLLLRPKAESLNDLDQFIRSRGGNITLTTISKALRRLEDDVLIQRQGGKARLLQPESLLDKLVAAYRPPKLRKTFIGTTSLDRVQLAKRFASLKPRTTLTGQSSTDRYAVMGREERIRFYTESISVLLDALRKDVQPGDRFANLELLETDDPTVYFDARRADALTLASPIQTYLELARGDKREQDTARQVRDLLLSDLRPQMEAL